MAVFNSPVLQVKLTLERDEFCGFDFVDFLEASDRDQNQRKPLNIRVVKVRGGGSGSSATVHFLIRPTVIGTMKLIVRAVGNDVMDVIEQNLPVEGEGFPIYVNKPLLLDVSVQDKFQTTLKMDLPPATALVRGSERAEISVVGDIMGVSLNLEELIRMPLGCGEQNMMKLVPNIVIWKYLNATGRLTNELSTKLRNFLESGYQQQLTYMHNDYSFSAFGQSDRQGSTWLTAFVVQWLKQAEPIIYVDPNILQNSLKFLQLQQKETGEFEEFGEVHIKSLHGGTASTSVALTAYVLIALQMNGHSNPDAVNYLESQLNSIKNDLFVLAVTTYSLALAKSLKKETAAQLLKNLSRNKDGLIYWQRSPTGKVDAKLESQSQVITKPIDVETASYLLLTSVIDGALEDATPVARWLAAQRNSLGGFSSSKDTVMGIQALGAYAEATFTTDLDIEVSIEQMGRKHRVKVNRNNSIATQKLQLDDLFSPVVVEATGYGVAFVQLSGLYNVLHPKQLTPFLCEKSVYQPTAKDLILEICCKSNLPNDGGKMALMLVKSLSGYSLIAEQLGSLTESVTELQRVEVLNDTQASLYFSSVSKTNPKFSCLH